VKGKKAYKRFRRMGALGRQMLKLSNKNGMDINRLIVHPTGEIEVCLNTSDEMILVRGFQDCIS
jgi:hypothetical protein